MHSGSCGGGGGGSSHSNSRDGDGVRSGVLTRKLIRKLALVPSWKSLALVLLVLGGPAAAADSLRVVGAGVGIDAGAGMRGSQEKGASITLDWGSGVKNQMHHGSQDNPDEDDGGRITVVAGDNLDMRKAEDNAGVNQG